MKEITNEQKLYVLLKHKKNRTKKDEQIISILKEKAELGDDNLAEANKECRKQKWLNTLHVVEELGYTTKSCSRVELSEPGLSQISKFWRESKYNPRNVWKSRLKVWIAIIGTILTVLLSLVQIWLLLSKTETMQ